MAAAGVLAVGVAAAALWWQRPGTAAPERTGAGAATTPAADASAPAAITALAVLPFANVGAGADAEYFSDGMTDELTGALAKVPGLRVAARSSAFAFKGRNVDAREVGRALGVGALVAGTVRRAGERVRVSAELTSAADGLVLWSESYERRMTDVFAMQDELARAIAGALRTRLAEGGAAPATVVGEAPGAARGTRDLAAYDLYLRGRYHFHQRGADALRQAHAAFAEAVARDPSFARAHAGLADVAALLPVYGSTPADSAYPAARRSAARAVALDSTLAEAHTTLALAEMRLARWAESERAYRRALALDPRYAPAHQWYGELLIVVGRVEEAAAEMRAAAALDPLSPVVQAELAYTLGLLGRTAEGERAGRRAVELAPTLWLPHAFLAYVHLFGGRAADAVRGLERAAELDPAVTTVQGTLAFAYGQAGDRARARALADRLVAQAAEPGGSAVAAAIALLGAGDREGALGWLATAAARRDSWLYAMGLNPPFYDAVRGDPRFVAVARTMGLDARAIAPPQGAR
jgi:serine/threonine-protein kinase